MPKRFIFTVTTGRSGQMSLSNLLKANVGNAVVAHEEPNVKPMAKGCSGSLSEYSAPDQRFAPTSYVAIAEFVERKCRALACYEGEIREFPHPRSPEALVALARVRGAECGLEAAEGFVLLRGIER